MPLELYERQVAMMPAQYKYLIKLLPSICRRSIFIKTVDDSCRTTSTIVVAINIPNVCFQESRLHRIEESTHQPKVTKRAAKKEFEFGFYSSVTEQ